MDGGTAAQNIIRNNSASYGGGLYGGNANVVENTIQDNQASLAGGGIYATAGTVNGNTIIDNTTSNNGGGLYATGGLFNGNTISNNEAPSWGHGSGAYLTGTAEFSYNTVVSNTASGGSVGGIAINGQPQVQYNNLYDNQPYDAEMVSPDDVSATLNYWGNLPCTAIGGQIYDGNDLPGRGKLGYAPSLYAPITLAQLSTPDGLTMTAIDDSSFTLTWTPIADIPNVGCREPNSSAPDLGYRLFYDTESGCAFSGLGLPAGDLPIDVGENSAITLLGVPEGEFYFSVVAYDYLGRVSSYSNVVVRQSDQYKIYLPIIVR